jgi:hypothetical protein
MMKMNSLQGSNVRYQEEIKDIIGTNGSFKSERTKLSGLNKFENTMYQ